MTIEERANELYPYPYGWEWNKNKKWAIDPYGSQRESYIKGAVEQKEIDIETIPQLYVRWLMIEGEKPSWKEYANKVMEE